MLNLIQNASLPDSDIKEELKKTLSKLTLNTENPELNFELAFYYHRLGHTASAFSHYLRCAERTKNNLLSYECLIRGFFCFDQQGDRKFTAKHLLNQAIIIEPKRPEAYFLLARFYERIGEWYDCYTTASLALNFCDFNCGNLITNVEYPGKLGILFQKAIGAWWWDKVDEAKDIFEGLLRDYDLPQHYKDCIVNNLRRC